MKTMNSLIAGAISTVAMMTASNADAAVVFDISQDGTSVVATASGTFDRSLSNFIIRTNGTSFINASGARLFVGSGTTTDSYKNENSPKFGSGFTTFASTTSGITTGFNDGRFFIDTNYISNSAIFSSSTFSNQTLTSLGLINGVYSFSAGGNAVTLNIGQAVAAVPEPATWAMMLVGFGMIGAASRYRRRHSTVRYA